MGRLLLTRKVDQGLRLTIRPEHLAELGDLIRERELDDGFSMAFVSDSPFLHRKRNKLDDFQSEALKTFRQDRQRTELWQVVPNSQGGSDIRLAIPVRMEAGCVACHNSHPSSPVRNWAVGDVRGIQERGMPKPAECTARVGPEPGRF